ncbi:hypothetical protein Ais01nite_19790 [Asanoa ishikariensis]|uniref:Peptidase inhibitor family I36 n=1 Tax=Asanoa ishikariensis TaxID=137265 RepID=A0A1H3UAW7_9ACTN|nr:hypothetical protein [Asanoa ishikariensis]GIF63944.1 hypothetical protein Ais01nite_19790 [Asanoa ishikariensis]SDZ59538.1 hypothetical protein SAMN05421684_6894 [Asanoa ishikariensis]
MRIPARILLACTIILAMIGMPAVAQATGKPGASASQSALNQQLLAANPCGGWDYACADGNFYVGAPSGIPTGLCIFSGVAPTLGGCTNRNSSVTNRGTQCNNCDWIRLYWGSNYTGAWFCIQPGYAYDMWENPGLVFNKGSGKSGFGSTVWLNAASAKWTGAC